MQKSKNKKLMYIFIGGLFLVLLGTLAQSGHLLQGNLNINRFSAPEESTTAVNVLIPTSQIRLGDMPFFKMSLPAKKDLSLEKIKFQVSAYDISLANTRLYRNDKDITSLLTQETQKDLQQPIQAQGKSLSRILTFNFATPLGFEKGTDIYELRTTTSVVTKSSTLRTSVIDIMATDGGMETIIRGPEQITNLEVTYLKGGK